MSDIISLHRELVSRAIDGEGRASRAMRRSALNNDALEDPTRTLVSKMALDAKSVTDEDFRAVRAAEFSEEEIFEIVVDVGAPHPGPRRGMDDQRATGIAASHPGSSTRRRPNRSAPSSAEDQCCQANRKVVRHAC